MNHKKIMIKRFKKEHKICQFNWIVRIILDIKQDRIGCKEDKK